MAHTHAPCIWHTHNSAAYIGMAARALTSPRAHYNITILRDARRHGAYLQDKVLLYDVCACCLLLDVQGYKGVRASLKDTTRAEEVFCIPDQELL